MPVELRPLDEELLTRLTRAAVAGADPDEVMPPVPGDEADGSGWTPRREAAFAAFHRERSLGPDADQDTYAVLGADGEVLGAARLAPVPGERGTVEGGLWLVRDRRGQGLGRRALRLLFATARARWHRRLLLCTTAENAAVRRLVTEEFGARWQPRDDGGLAVRITLRPMAALLMSRPSAIEGLPAATGPDAADAPRTPGPLLADWLAEAVEAGVADLQAAVVSTVDADGLPDARVLLLRDVAEDGGEWTVATDAGSPAGRQFAARPAAALTLYWPPLGRQLRVRGTVAAAGPQESAAEFRSRSPRARVAGLVGRQSEPLPSTDAYRAAEEEARRRLAADPDAVPAGHTVYRLTARQVEFWQGDPGRLHRRLRYTRTGPAAAWTRTRLWP